MGSGRSNITAGLLSLIGFATMGFLLIYLRDFGPGKEEWVASYSIGKHFETRLAHVHGNLFALLNIAIGLMLPRMGGSSRVRSWISGLAILGMLMPFGIVGEIAMGTPPWFVMIGGAAMLVSLVLATIAWMRTGI